MFESSPRISSPVQGGQATAWAYLGELEAMAHWLTDGSDSSPTLASAVAEMDTYRGSTTTARWLHRVAAAHTNTEPGDLVLARLEAVFNGARNHGPVSPELSSEVLARLGVLESLCCIPDNYRTALLLKEGAGLTVQRTAALMGVSTASLRSILYRARRALIA